MNILFISNLSNGVNSFSLASILTAQKTGSRFYLAANFMDTPLEKLKGDEEKYEIHICPIDIQRSPYSPRNIIAYHQLIELVKTEKIDCIHCNTPTGGLLGRLVGKKCGVKKVIYQAHGFHFYKGAPLKNWLIYYPIEKWLARYTDILIAINQEDYHLAKREMHLRKNGKIYYVPGVGIDLTQYEKKSNNRNAKRNDLGVAEKDVVLISVGRLDKNKNNEALIKAVSLCNNSDIHLLICGDGPERKKLQFLTEKLNIEKQIHFLGNRSDMIELYQAADIFVMASYREGLSRSIMEAMASGLPCVVSNIRGNKDLIDEGKGGKLFDPKDIEDLATKISGMYHSDFKKRGAYNLDSIQKFSLENVINKMKIIYSEMKSC